MQHESTGQLSLSIARRDDGVSYARHQYHHGALRVISPHYLDRSGQVTYTVINPGGAYFSNDVYTLDFQVEPKAALLVNTQSATKVYRTPYGPAMQQTQVRLDSGAIFEYLANPLIVYREGAYQQKTCVQMAPDAHFLQAEIVTPGWSPDGEHFQYEDIRLRTEISVGAELAVVDQLRLAPQESDFGLGVLEGYSHCGQLLVVDARLSDAAFDALADIVAASPAYAAITRAGRIGPACFSVRSLAHDSHTLESLHKELIDTIRAFTGNRPALTSRSMP